jgi:hypothetical protein
MFRLDKWICGWKNIHKSTLKAGKASCRGVGWRVLRIELAECVIRKGIGLFPDDSSQKHI